jgi:ubiquinone/menaquinone biosynthesis C-methylase UbiE
MGNNISNRLKLIIDALPLRDGIRILEIGCGPGAAAREISKRIGKGHILAIDRSAKAIKMAISGSRSEIESGRLAFRQAKIEEFVLGDKEKMFDIVFAVRVGAFDGRHPEIEIQALTSVANVLKTGGKFFIDGGNPLKEVDVSSYRRQSK